MYSDHEVAVSLLVSVDGRQAQENSVKANLRLGDEAVNKGKPEELMRVVVISHFRAVTQL